LKLPKHAKRRRTIVAVAAATLVPAAALIASTAASPGPSAGSGTVAVPQGIGADALRGASVFGTTPANTPETVSFVLRARNLQNLEATAETGHGGLSVQQFAAQYGQQPGVIAALEHYLSGFGISASGYADGLDVVAQGTAGEFNSALSVQQKEYAVPAVPARDGRPAIPAQRVHGTAQQALLPQDIGRSVLSVLGLTNYSAFATSMVHAPGIVDRGQVTAAQISAASRPRTTYTGTLTPEDFARTYGLDPLYARGVTGSGETIGIVTLASLSPSAPYYFWQKVLGLKVAAGRVTVVNVDGGPGAPSETAGSGETDLDVEQSGAIAPQAKIVVYQAPNTDYGYADGFFTAASDNVADTVSSSWGESETDLAATIAAGQESPSYVAALDEAFLELDVQGQSAFTSAGDSGAYDASGDLGTTNLSVDNPSDSPFITAAGGTTLGGTISFTGKTSTVNVPIPQQRAWGWDWLWPYWSQLGVTGTEDQVIESNLIIGGGGGFSAFEQTPFYQQGVSGAHSYSAVRYLTPTTYKSIDGLNLPTAWNLTLTPPELTGFATGRATPDVSADADPFTGYLLYDPLAATPLQGGWGGTSFVAPQLNASAALIDQYAGHRTGFWNPSIYQFAQLPNSPFTPLGTTGTSNDNLYYTGTQGQVFNAGTGLGVPNLSMLAADFASGN
jgi:kumamolisin